MARTLALVTFLWLMTTTVAHASCAPPPPLRQRLGEARTAFVGTVQATSNAQRNATVRVERIWLGPVLPPTVEVIGGAQGTNVASSADRTWVENETYLFVLADPEPPFTDEACSATTVYTDRVAALEPDGAIEPEGDGPSGGPWLLVAAALLAAGVLQVRRAARRAQTLDGSGAAD